VENFNQHIMSHDVELVKLKQDYCPWV
jgi:hypothetical protein